VAVIMAGALFATGVVGVENLDVGRLFGVAGALALYNAVVFLMVRPLRDRERAAASYYVLTGIMHGVILLDFVFLTIALWLVGGARSPFQAFYIFNVILASVLLTRGAAFAHAALGYLMLAVLVVGEWAGWIPPCEPAGAVAGAGPLDGRYVITLLIVYGALFALSTSMLTSLVQVLRAGERGLRKANAKLEQLSALRRDFLQMVLHDLKTPIVAIAQHLYNLDAQLRGSIGEQEGRWLDRCQQRIKEASDFLRDLQVLALLESDALQDQKIRVDLEVVLNEVIAENRDLAQMRNHTLTLEVAGPLDPVYGIGRLLHEVVLNLVTNAVKYTPVGGAITVRARNQDDAVRIEVQDNGIGISLEDQRRLFQEFGRIRRRVDAGVDVTGSSGLGLAIARRIVEIHDGAIEVQSELNHGSTFIVTLPAARTILTPDS
jgi:signal transduction histidine kinase